MDFENAVEYLESFISYENMTLVKYAERNYNLERLKKFIDDYGIDYSGLKFFHVAGSKGKGSVSTLIANYLNAYLASTGVEGPRVGLFVSPHMVSTCERIVLNGEMMPEKDFSEYVLDMKDFIESVGGASLTYFELLFVMALKYFADKGVEYVVLEVGLGGRLDATNIVVPEVSVVSTIELEHTEVLGDTISQILNEKLGIVKGNVPLVVGYQSEEVCGLIKGKIASGELPNVIFVEDVMGKCEDVAIRNPNVASVAIDTVLGGVDVSIMSDVVRDFKLPGRFDVREIDGKTVVFDMAHTENSVNALVHSLLNTFPDRTFTFLISIMKGKCADKMIGLVYGIAERIVYTESHLERGMKASKLAEIRPGEIISDCFEAYNQLLADTKKDQVLVITGSHFLVGKILSSGV